MAEQRTIEHGVAFLELLCAILAAGLWFLQETIAAYAGISVGPWPLLLLGVLGVLRWRRTGRVFQQTRFIPPLVLFTLAALIGLWAAYDLTLALSKFWLIVAALGLCWAMAQQPDLTSIYLSLALWGSFGVVLTAYFLMTHDWSAYPTKVPFLTDLGRWLSGRLPSLPTEQFNPNIVGGMLATIAPCYLPLIALPRQSKRVFIRRWLPLLWAVAGAVTLTGVVLAVSRGAWVALSVTAGLWGLWRLRVPLQQHVRLPKRRYVVGGGLTVGLILAILATSMAPAAELPGTAALQNRLTLLRSGSRLARDYLFTGIGPGTFELHYAVYNLLIHVGYVPHTHNLFLDLLIELGILGIAAYLWLTITALVHGAQHLERADANTAWLIETGLALQIMIVVHGLVDDVLFGSRALFLLFIPYGLLASASSMVNAESEVEVSATRETWTRFAYELTLAIVCFAIVVWWSPILSAWHANLGAIAQARVELSQYDQATFDVLSLDDIRQQADLGRAIRSFEKALARDPTNLTAHQRLASIALARGDDAQALAHMQAAWDAQHRDPTTRLLLGDSLVATGNVDLAVEIVRDQKFAKDRLAGQAWSRYWEAGRWKQALSAWQAVLALDPTDANAAYWIEQAEERIQTESASK